MVVLEQPLGARAPRARPGHHARPATRSRWCTATTARASSPPGSACSPVRRGRRRRRSTATTRLRGAVPRGARGRSRRRRAARLQPPLRRADRRARRGAPAVRPHPRQPASRSPTSCARSSRRLRDAAPRHGRAGRARGRRARPDVRARRHLQHRRRRPAVPGRRARTPVSVGETAGEGGAWGIAVLAAFLRDGRARPPQRLPRLRDLREGRDRRPSSRSPDDVAGFDAYMERHRGGLAIERAAVEALA